MGGKLSRCVLPASCPFDSLRPPVSKSASLLPVPGGAPSGLASSKLRLEPSRSVSFFRRRPLRSVPLSLSLSLSRRFRRRRPSLSRLRRRPPLSRLRRRPSLLRDLPRPRRLRLVSDGPAFASPPPSASCSAPTVPGSGGSEPRRLCSASTSGRVSSSCTRLRAVSPPPLLSTWPWPSSISCAPVMVTGSHNKERSS